MLIMQKGLRQGVLDEELYAGMTLVSAATCVAAPVLLAWLLRARRAESTA
jgi:hypothetical protein